MKVIVKRRIRQGQRTIKNLLQIEKSFHGGAKDTESNRPKIELFSGGGKEKGPGALMNKNTK
jgi:hypothetical protein